MAAAAPASPAIVDHTVDDEASQKMFEAEGVLAEELAQLMAETEAAEPQAAPPAAVSVPPAASAAEVQTLPETETSAPSVHEAVVPPATSLPPENIAQTATPAEQPIAPAAQEAVPATPIAAPAETSAAVQNAPAAEASTASDPKLAQRPPGAPEFPVVILLPDETFEDAEPESKGRLARLFNDIVLMFAQILDLPFGWIDVVNKNLLGFAAFLLLASGVGLMTVAWWLARH